MREAALPVTANLTMPKLGLTMAEGLLSEWMVKPGDTVARGQTLFLVETDKTTNEIDAPAPGTILSLIVEPGETVPVGAVVALWTGPSQGGTAPARDEPAPEPAIAAPVAREETGPTQQNRALITPFARRLAQIGGVDIAQIVGSGPRGRIQARDVQAKIDQVIPVAAAVPDLAAAPPPASPGPARNLRPLIAARVSRSKAEIPHFYVTADAKFDALSHLRAQLNGDPQADRKLSVTAFLAIAVARALVRQPAANAVWRSEDAIPIGQIAVGIAVDTPGGVVAPVVPVSGDIYAFAAAMDGAITRARAGRMSQADRGSASIGISNVGMFAVRALTPIIDPDQSFMLGVGAPVPMLIPGRDGQHGIVHYATLTLACDHRLIDGAPAAQFLAEIVSNIEHPLRLLLPVSNRT